MPESDIWSKDWTEFKETTFFGRFLRSAQKKTMEKVFSEINIDSSAKVVDVGCGSGITLKFLKDFFKNSIGVDNSKESIELCKKLFGFEEGKDVFLMDANKTKFSNDQFDLVFSDGLLEHFQDPTSLIREMCRISGKWVLLFQPDRKSMINKVKQLASSIALNFKTKGRFHAEAATWKSEYNYTLFHYKEWFEKFNFNLVNHGGLNFNESMWLLFKKVKK
jgi:ubiquinone/menaquinone biosynthesis C-methylase UbiE